MAFFWLGLFVVLLIIEICTINLVSIWFAIGAFVSFFVSMFTENIFIQGAVFLVVSLLTLLVTKPFIKKMKFQNVRTNLDRVVGMEGVVTEEISKFEIGEVKVDGKRWSAKSDSSISVGDVVEIERIDGVKLIQFEYETISSTHYAFSYIGQDFYVAIREDGQIETCLLNTHDKRQDSEFFSVIDLLDGDLAKTEKFDREDFFGKVLKIDKSS